MSRVPEHLASRPAWSLPDAEGECALEPLELPTEPSERFSARGEIGSGGMGRVRLVRDAWLDRLIAVKEPATEQDRRRLWREALVTARLDHPGIVPVYDLGLSPGGVPWFAMRVVRGRSLAELLATTAGSPERLLRPLLAACEAVGYAHHQGVVHRDLKPANLMIGPFGEMQVIDWGLALVADLPHADLGSAGTPRYMSPEQARGDVVGPASDVFSLGVVLQEVFSGSAIPRELAAIIARCGEEDPGRRYADAKALAADLEAYLDGRRVGAHEYTTFELVSRLAHRWRGPLIAVGLSLIVLAVMLIVGVERVRAERDLAEANLAMSLVREAQHALGRDRLIDATVLASEALERGARGRFRAEARGILAAVGVGLPSRAELQTGVGDLVDLSASGVLSLRDGSLTHTERGRVRWSVEAERDTVGRYFADGQLVGIARGRSLRVLAADTGTPLWERDNPCWSTRQKWLEESADGRSLWSWHRNCAARVTREGIEPLAVDLCGEPAIHALTSHADGERVAVTCGDGAVVLWDGLAARRFAAGLGTPSSPPLPTAIAFVGEDVLVGSADGGVDWITLGAGERVEKVRLARAEGLVRRIEVDPEGRWAVVIADSDAPLVLDLERRSILLRLPQSARHDARFVGAALVTTALGEDHFVHERWDLGGLRPRRQGFPDGVTRVAVARDGRIAVGDGAQVVLLDEARRVTSRHRWQDSIIKTLGFAPDGVLVAHGQRTFDVLAFEGDVEVGKYQTPSVIFRRMGLLTDGSIVAADYGNLRWRARRDRPPVQLAGAEAVVDLAASVDGRSFATLYESGEVVCVWDVIDDTHEVPCGRFPSAIAIGLTGRDVVALMRDGVVREGPAGRERLDARGADLVSLAVSERAIAAGDRGGAVWLWGEDRDPILIRQHSARVDSVAFGPGGWLVSGGWDGHIALASPADVTPRASEMRARFGLDLGALFEVEQAD